MQKLVIVGIDSLAGANLALVCRERCETVGISRRGEFELDGRTARRIRAGSPGEVAAVVRESQPNWVVYCGLGSRSRWDWTDAAGLKGEAAEVKAAVAAIDPDRCRFTLVSSDAVFTGPRLFHSEVSADANPDAAARAARQVEQAVDTARGLIVRTHLFGWSPGGDSFAERLWGALAEGRPVAASGAIYSTPILASDFAELLYRAYRRELSGVYHLGGAERTSAWQFATALAAATGMPGRVQCAPKVMVESRESARACQDETSLDSRKIQRALSTPLSLVRESLSRFVDQATNGYRERIVGKGGADAPAYVMVTAAA